MTGLDTNVLVRYFVHDDLEQSKQVRDMFRGFTVNEPGWVATETVLEFVWVMKSVMRFDRMTIVRLLDALLGLEELVIEDGACVTDALDCYRRTRADFADCLIAASARAAGCGRVVTFDRVAARDAGMELLA
jgi:predicted nucleic-acid-binding protein